MMHFNHIRTVALVLMIVALGGSGCGQNPLLPATMPVTMPDGSVIDAALGSGVPFLANTNWACYRLSDDEFIVRVEFGAGGELVRFYDNTFYFPEILGATIIPDGQVRSCAFPGLSYAAGTYAASADPQLGFVASMDLFFLSNRVATGTAYAWGAREGDRLTGTFGFETSILATGSPVPAFNDEYEFYAIRE